MVPADRVEQLPVGSLLPSTYFWPKERWNCPDRGSSTNSLSLLGIHSHRDMDLGEWTNVKEGSQLQSPATSSVLSFSESYGIHYPVKCQRTIQTLLGILQALCTP